MGLQVSLDLQVTLFFMFRAMKLRSSDRDNNLKTYPALDYPEIYLLDRGYRQLFYSDAGFKVIFFIY